MTAFQHQVPSRKWQHRSRGAAQIEFAVSILVVMFVLFWTWEVLMLVYTHSVLSDAAKEGVRYAIVHGTRSTSCSGPSCVCDPSDPSCIADTVGNNVCNVVRDYAQYSLHYVPGGTSSGCSASDGIQVFYLDSSSDPVDLPRVQVTISYPFVPYLNLPITPQMWANAQGRIVN